jgi:hypothetical protein
MTASWTAIYGLSMTVNEKPGRIQDAAPPLLGSTYLLPLAVGVIQIVGTRFAALRQPERLELDALGLVLLAVGPGALALRRRYPVGVLAFVLATTLG